ncbi:MAG: hypothetical protein H0W64_12155 [Gammaproteobacteria bacterium]|nr:hypothetical protein [Gammaproteobacteria bacterium]
MKFLPKALSCAAMALFLATPGFALKQVECPPLSAIQSHANFVQAQRAFDNMWAMNANAFKSNGNDWNVILGVDLPGVSTPQQALEAGTAFYKNHVTLSEPSQAREERGYQICIYFQGEKSFVVAVNPPLLIEGQLNSIRKFMK